MVGIVDNPATKSGALADTERVPSSYLIPQLIKIDGERISRIEGMVKWMPFGYSLM